MPDLKLGNTDITTVKLGSTQVDKVYLGSNLVWSSWAPLDPDAATYINTLNSLPGVNLTLTEKQAVDNLFIRMKGNDPLYPNYGNNGIYAAAKGIYPYVGSNLAAYRYNAIFPSSVTQSQDNGFYPTGNGYQYISGGITVDGLYGPQGNGVNGVILPNMNWVSGYASSLSPTNLAMGAVYKTTSGTGRDDFGDYNAANFMAGIWLRTKPSSVQARLGCLETAVTGGNIVLGGRGHWMLHRAGASKRVYYQGIQASYTGGQDRSQEGQASFGGLNTWAFLGLNFTYFNGVSGFASEATRAANCVNFSANTLMFSYIMDGFSASLIPAWNQMVEAFCVETGKKTW